MGFKVAECDYDAVFVEALGQGADSAVETQLRLYLQVWQATRPELVASVEAVDPGP